MEHIKDYVIKRITNATLKQINLQYLGVFKFDLSIYETLDAVEKALIMASLQRTKGNQTKSAKDLGINRNTLGKRIKKHQLDEFLNSVANKARLVKQGDDYGQSAQTH